MTIAISYPFTLDDSGKIEKTDQYNKIYLDRVLTLLSTNVRQRPILQSYGSDTGQVSFESGNAIEDDVTNIIKTAIGTWLPDLFVHQINVGVPDENGISSIDVVIRLPNGNMSAVSLTTATFNYDGEITR